MAPALGRQRSLDQAARWSLEVILVPSLEGGLVLIRLRKERAFKVWGQQGQVPGL